jgi:hypothetical protein
LPKVYAEHTHVNKRPLSQQRAAAYHDEDVRGCHMRIMTTFAALAASCGAAFAGPVAFGPSLEGNGWRTLTFRSLPPLSFRPAGASQLDIAGDKGASLIWRALPEEDWPARAANWRWRVQQGPPATDLARRGEDDRAIALYFVFARDEAAARWARGSTSLSSAMWWSSGAALVYVYGGSGARGRVVASPHMGENGKLVIRQPGGAYAGAWISETADLAADFRRAFGREPGPLVGVAVSADGDDTGSRISAAIDAQRVE